MSSESTFPFFHVVTFRLMCSQGEMYIGHGRLCVCLSMCLSLAAFPHYYTDPDVTWGNGRGALLGGFAISAQVLLL